MRAPRWYTIVIWRAVDQSLRSPHPERRLGLVEAIGHPAVGAVRRLEYAALCPPPQLSARAVVATVVKNGQIMIGRPRIAAARPARSIQPIASPSGLLAYWRRRRRAA